jgi:hypothetical protein
MCKSKKEKCVSLYTETLLIASGLIVALLLSACSTMKTCPGYSPAEEAAKHVPLSSLSGRQKEKYEEVRKHIGTNKDFLYHDAVVEPNAFGTIYSFYLLGFEKPDDNSLSPYCRPNEISCSSPKFKPDNFKGGSNDDPDEILDTQKDIEKNLSEKPLVLTHVLNVGKMSRDMHDDKRDSCFIFNVYEDDADTPWCQNNHKANILNSGILKPDWKREGWRGLNQLAADINAKVVEEKATHIILLATGWNTRQYESYLDFKAWMDNLTEEFKSKHEEFRPIFIGTSWQSEWPWWEHIPFISEFTKGNDADEIGFTWENYLLNDLMRPIAKLSGAQLVVIGHSFGSRIALGAHYTRDIIVRNEPVADVPITIIGMQAAFPIARFVTTEGKEHQYVAANKKNATVVITSSKDDEATGKMCIGTAYVGAGCGLEELRKNNAYKDFVTVLPTSDDGTPTKPDDHRVWVYDASPFVNCQLEATKSGAHSDVYDAKMGHFLGEIIHNSAKP